MNQSPIQLSLSAAEAAVLEEVLSARLNEMRLELARTDDRQYRAAVHARLDQLELVHERLSSLLSPAAVAAPRV